MQQRDTMHLNEREQIEVVERLAELASAGVPLVEGLRAAQRDCDSARLQQALAHLATQLESGAALSASQRPAKDESADAGPVGAKFLPPHIIGLIHAGATTNSLDQCLTDLVDHYHLRRELKRRVLSALAYPTMVMSCSLATLIMLGLVLAEPMKEFSSQFDSFGMQVDNLWLLQQWIWVTDDGIPLLLSCLAGTLVLLFAFRIFCGVARFERLLAHLPLVGKLVTWSGMTEFSWLMRSMLERQIPLPQALALASDGLASRDTAQLSAWMAEGVQAGVPLSDLMAATTRIPAPVVPIVRWGEKSNSLAESMDSLYEMFQQRLHLRSNLVTSILVPAILLVTGVVLFAIVVGVLVPMANMVQLFTLW